jgi:hypothetical protein
MFKTAWVKLFASTIWIAGFAVGSQQFGDIVVSPLSFPVIDARHGYIEHRVRVVNTSPDRTHTVTVVLPGRSYSSRGSSINRLSRTVAVGPGTETTIPLYQPSLDLSGTRARISIDNGAIQETMELPSTGSRFDYYSDPKPNLLFSRSVNRDTVMAEMKKISPKHSGHYRGSGEYECAVTRPDAGIESWSDSWLAYTSFDGIFLKADDMDALPAETLRALWQYVECGGTLIVLGTVPPPGYCSGQVIEKDGITIHYAGFGEFITCNVKDETQLTASRLGRLAQSWENTGKPWIDKQFFSEPNGYFPVIEKLNIPIRSILLLMLVFVILIGPVNIIVLAKMNRRIWLLWTIPSLSFLFCIIVFIHSLLAEGITSTIRIENITLLDQEEHRAVSLGIAAYYCPLTPGDGLHFPYEYEVTPIIRPTGWRDQGTAKRIDDTRDQHFKSGWVTARVPAHFYIRSHEPRRERIELERNEDGSLTAVNGLGADIEQLVVADENGRLYSARGVKAGARAPLKTAGNTYGKTARKLTPRSLYAMGAWYDVVNDVRKKPASMLVPGSYYAELETAPFIREGLAGKAHRKHRSIVLGRRVTIPQ